MLEKQRVEPEVTRNEHLRSRGAKKPAKKNLSTCVTLIGGQCLSLWRNDTRMNTDIPGLLYRPLAILRFVPIDDDFTPQTRRTP